MAFESLLRNECDMALAGGVSIPFRSQSGYSYVPGMILSRDGHCRAFDAAASGTVPGAGAGIAVLKRLEDAIADGDHIYAVMRGAAINNDGSAKVGYSAPSVEGQSDVIRRSMQMAGFCAGIRCRMSKRTEPARRLAIQSKLPRFPRLFNRRRAAAFLRAGSREDEYRTSRCGCGNCRPYQNRTVRKTPCDSPTLHFTQPNPLIDFGKTPFYVNTSLSPYDKPGAISRRS